MVETGLKTFTIYDVRLTQLEPHIVCTDYGTRIVTADLIKEIHAKIAREWPGEKIALLVKGPGLMDIPAVAMALDKSDIVHLIVASALIPTSNLEEALAATLLDSRSSPYPTRLFSSEEEALPWLRRQLRA